MQGLAGYYTQQNIGKRNVCVDLRIEGGSELLLRMAAEADVVIENFRPGVMKRYGLAYENLRQVNEKLVMLSISGFGQEGPRIGSCRVCTDSSWRIRVASPKAPNGITTPSST